MLVQTTFFGNGMNAHEDKLLLPKLEPNRDTNWVNSETVFLERAAN
jgi:hypothetical protein